MKFTGSKLMRWVVIVMLLLSASVPAVTVAGRGPVVTTMAAAEPERNVQRILIKVQPGVDAPTGRLAYSAAPTAFTRVLMGQGVTTVQTLFRAEAGTLNATGLERIYRVELEANADVNKTVAALSANPNIEWAEPDYIAHAVAIPNDPLYGEQWGLAKIDAPPAWNIVTGTQTVVIAIVDSGIDLTHLDLQANLWANPGEIAGNGIDDDNNGYVDDVRGWNFVNGTNNVSDGSGHGTQVAGVAAAVTNNALGIAGVCWNCKIMPVRVMADSGISNYSDIALGVKYAADKGANVINLSLGGYAYSNALRDAINYAVNEKNVVVVAGAGNDNVSTPFYPAAYENVLAVAGTTNVDTKAAFSDYGTWVDVSAPAVEITTTYMGGDWGVASGTSLAAPFVAGVAALIRSYHPPTEWNATMVRNQILQTVDNIDPVNPAYAGQLGAGRVNAAKAMQPPRPVIALAGTSVNGDPLGRPVPGESATLAVTLRNDWWDAAGVTGVLSTADPYVTLSQATASYGNLASGAMGTSSPIYAFTVAAGAGYNHPIPFILTVSADDGAYSVMLPFTITTRSGEELVCGSIPQDTVWTSDKTYIATCNIGIAPGVTLTIQPGTEVRFNATYGLNVGGTLLADGTADQPIRMVANGANGWRGIRFDDASVDAQADAEGRYLSGNLLRHVSIEGSAFGINVLSATPYLAHLDLNATTVVSQSISGSLGDTPLWLMDSTISGGETAVILTGAVNAYRNIIAGVGFIVITGPATISSNTFSGGGITVGYGGAGTISNNVIAGGGIYIDGVSSIQKNIVQGGSIDAPNTTTVLSNTVQGGGILVGENSEVRGNDVSGASEWGINGTTAGTIVLTDGAINIRAIDNRIVGNQNGIAVASGLVQGNLIANNAKVGLALGEATVISNTLTGNRGSAVKVSWSQPLTFAGNNLEGNLGQYDFENTISSSSSPTLDARNNWWGTTNTALIQQRIFDGNDDYNFGVVLYNPMLTAPNTAAPAYVRAVTLTPESPIGIQTVMFDVLFSREMDTGFAPTLEFYTPIQESWQTYTVGNSSWLLTRIRDIAIDFSDNLWLATAKGASVRYANGSGRTYTTDNSGIATNNLMSVMIDKEGNRWFGHEMEYSVYETAKVSVLRSNGSWQIYSPTNSSLAGYRVTVITEDDAGNTWFGTHGGGLSVLQADETWQMYNPSNSVLRSYDLNAVFADSKGNIWIGEEGISVLRVDGTWENYDTTNSSLTHNSAFAIFEDSSGNMWFGSIGGIHKLDATGNWYFYNDNGIDAYLNQAMSIAEDRFGNLWFGTPDGLSIFDTATKTWKTYTPENSDLVNRWVSGIVNESTGNLWVGVEQGINAISILGGNVHLTPTGVYWPANDRYSATYDFNSLVPRGVYTLTVSNARMSEINNGDGMEIAPNSGYTFTVDYAGAIADTTPPPAPSMTACAAETPDALSAEWDASDPDSAITLYQYSIGTTSGGIEVVYWTSTAETSMIRSSLTLLTGQTYYISVKARNEGGLWSAPSSVGVVAGSGGCVSNVTQWNIYLPLVLRN